MSHNPSVYAHTISGGILAVGIIYSALYITKNMSYPIVVLLLLFSIAIGIGIGIGIYNYNPLSLLSGKHIEPFHPADCSCGRHYNPPHH
jgi:hypothetical protein